MTNNKKHIELIEQLRNGDMGAFDTLYFRYSQRLYGFVVKLIKKDDDAEEIVQEVFIKIWESRKKIDTYKSFESFLFTIAYNSTITLLRKRVNERKYIDHVKSLQSNIASANIIDEIHYTQLNEKVQTLINQLTPRQKEIFKLSREQGLTNNEIAKELNLSVNTVENHISKALNFLKSNIVNDLTVTLFFVFLFL